LTFADILAMARRRRPPPPAPEAIRIEAPADFLEAIRTLDCCLCTRPADLRGVFLPDFPGPAGDPVGYALCSECKARPGVLKAVEDRYTAFLESRN
jgi:hypothetical protein